VTLGISIPIETAPASSILRGRQATGEDPKDAEGDRIFQMSNL
jgi:hypothetical protein